MPRKKKESAPPEKGEEPAKEKDSLPKEKKLKKAAVKSEVDSKKQPVFSIGLVGHVDHGKTTLVKAISGKWTDTHSEEIKRGITIRLGYADVTFYKCPKCSAPDCYTVKLVCQKCGTNADCLRTVSLVDAPGHESLMATMLCGANIMDGALLLIAANEDCPQPQTREHLMALSITGIKNLIVVQNKVDIVSEEQATKNYNQIKAFLKAAGYSDAPIIPVSAMHSLNIDALIEAIEQRFISPERNVNASPLMFVARSFDINKPGIRPAEIVGGVLGGSIKRGKLSVGQDIMLLPGYEVEEKNVKVWKPLTTKIVSLMAGGVKVDEACPGGSMAIMTLLEPSVVKSDKLTGSVVGLPDTLPPVWHNFNLEIHLLERVVGAKDELVVSQIKPNEVLMLNVNSAATVGIVTKLGKGMVECRLKRPVCAEAGSRVTLARLVGQRWRLIGYGKIIA